MPALLGECGCGCQCCRYVIVLIFRGSRGAADNYTLHIPAANACDTPLSYPFTDNSVATGERAVVIGNIVSYCSSVVTRLQNLYGATAVQTIQTTGLHNMIVLPFNIQTQTAVLCDGSIGSPQAEFQLIPDPSVTIRSLTAIVTNACTGCDFDIPDPSSAFTASGPGIGYHQDWNVACCCECCGADLATGTGSVSVSSNVATSGTGLVSATNYFSWSNVGADGANAGSTYTGTTTGGIGFTATLLGPGHFERRNSQFPSYSGDFTPGEPLLFAASPDGLTYAGDIEIVFNTPLRGVGFRVQQNNATFRDDFFFHAYNGGSLINITGTGDGLFVDASAPGANSAPFYGTAGCCCPNSPYLTIDKVIVGFAGSPASGPKPSGFAISTLEVLTCA